MKDNNTPDRASEFDDIPTYQKPDNAADGANRGDAATGNQPPQKNDIYSRMGRVAPQSIPARGSAINDTDEPEIKPLGDPDHKAVDSVDHSKNTPEFVAPKPQNTPDAADAASDTPASKPKEKKLFGRKKNDSAAEKTEILQRDNNSTTDRDVNVVKESKPVAAGETQETTAFPRADRNAPLASDAPTSAGSSAAPAAAAAGAAGGATAASALNKDTTASNNYDDSDFAPARDTAHAEAARPQETTQFAATESQRTVPAQTAPAAAAAVPPAAATGMFTSSPNAAAPAAYEEEHHTEQAPTVVENAKRGTIDFGLLIIRLLLGAYLIYSSIRVFFGVGGFGLNELQSSFSDYAMPEVLAIAIPAMELAAGVFLVFGLLTPVAAAVATVSTMFLAAHTLYTTDGWSLSSIPEGVLLALILAGIALALQFTGPGLISLDTSRSWAKRPLASSWVFAIIGIAGAVALWWFGAGVNPLA